MAIITKGCLQRKKAIFEKSILSFFVCVILNVSSSTEQMMTLKHSFVCR